MQNPSDAQAQLEQITADLERDRARLAAVGRQARRPVAGTDDSGLVEVGLDRHGRLVRVRVDNAWERRLGADGLGSAVIAAYGAAVAVRAERWAGGFDEDGNPRRASPATVSVDDPAEEDDAVDESVLAPAPADPETVTDRAVADSMELPRRFAEALQNRGPEVTDEAMVGGLLSFLEDADRAFDSALGQIDALAAGTATGRSSSGRVTAVVSLAGGEPRSLDIDSSWAVGAHPFNISREVVEAVNDAQRVAAVRAADQTGVEDVRRLQDPQELLERMRLI
jgi:DNA-binding protein YbaB